MICKEEKNFVISGGVGLYKKIGNYYNWKKNRKVDLFHYFIAVVSPYLNPSERTHQTRLAHKFIFIYSWNSRKLSLTKPHCRQTRRDEKARNSFSWIFGTAWARCLLQIAILKLIDVFGSESHYMQIILRINFPMQFDPVAVSNILRKSDRPNWFLNRENPQWVEANG